MLIPLMPEGAPIPTRNLNGKRKLSVVAAIALVQKTAQQAGMTQVAGKEVERPGAKQERLKQGTVVKPRMGCLACQGEREIGGALDWRRLSITTVGWVQAWTRSQTQESQDSADHSPTQKTRTHLIPSSRHQPSTSR